MCGGYWSGFGGRCTCTCGMASSPSRRCCRGWTTRSVRARCRVRQGALRRHIRHSGVAGVADAGHRGVARLGGAHRAGDPLQPHRADGRARPDPDGPDHGARGSSAGHAGGGVLTGKYGRSDLEPSPDGERPAASRSWRGTGSSPRGLDIAAVVGTSPPSSAPPPRGSRLPGRCSTPLSPHRSWELAAWLSSTTTSGPSTSGSIPRGRPGWPR